MRPDEQPTPQIPPRPPSGGSARPSMRVINDIQAMQRPPQSSASLPQRRPGPSTDLPPVDTPKVSHPNDHLLEAPREARLEDGLDGSMEPPRKKRSKLKLAAGIFGALLVLISVAVVGALIWYQGQLKPIDDKDEQYVRVSIEDGVSPARIGQILRSEGVIRNELAFSIYLKLSGTENTLKAGTYTLSKSNSVQQIVDHIVSGKQDVFTLTFLPGDTLENNRKKIIKAGYSEKEVDAALDKTYARPLFAGKPESADLEGYIFGETYEFLTTATVEDILNRTFDEYEKYINTNDLVNGYKKKGLSLFEGITLASIIQKEVASPDDSAQVAQVFYKRLKEGIALGADATFVYAAKKEGRTPAVDFDSPYNTRTHRGLPPGPISMPGGVALSAAANPASGDYLYFVSGDDGKNYFSKTLQEHEMKTRTHCIKNCALF